MIPIKDIDNFIKRLSELARQNPDLEITSNMIYSQLANYGLTNEELSDYSIVDQTDHLEEVFKQSQNLNVYYSKDQPGFLQFRSKRISSPDCKCVKMYVSVPKKYIEFASRKIFEFIENNNIESMSKVACKVRSDCIVLRVPDANQARMVMDFINNDRDLRKIARPTNPFSMKNGIVAMGYDDLLSYNSVTSSILSKYINELRDKGQLNGASIESFNIFLKQYREDVFHNCSRLSELTSEPNFIKYSNSDRFDYNPGKLIVNYEQIYRLLSFTIDRAVERKKSPFGLFGKDKEDTDEFLSFYDGCLDRQKSNELVDQYNQVLYSKKDNIKRIIDDYIKYIAQNESKEAAIIRLQRFYNGELDIITRKKDFRSSFSSITKSQFDDIIGSNLTSYVNGVLNERIENTNTQEQNTGMSQSYLYSKFCNTASSIINTSGVVGLVRALTLAKNGNFMYLGAGWEDKIKPLDIDNYCKHFLESIGYKISYPDVIVEFATELDKIVRPNVNSKQY